MPVDKPLIPKTVNLQRPRNLPSLGAMLSYLESTLTQTHQNK